jgi:hypothetical protein
MSATWASDGPGRRPAVTSSSDLDDVAAFAGHRHLAAGEADVRADDDQAVAPFRVRVPAVGPDVARL